MSSLFWLIALVLFSIIEAVTVGLVSIWFAAGSLSALIVSWLGGSLWVQIVVFGVISFFTMAVARPLTHKYLVRSKEATNADRAIGKDAVVTEEINNLQGSGAVSVSGVIWTARSGDDEIIPPGTTVRVLRIEGVKLFVTTKTNQ
ncbi:hypothetical protein SDC9_56936 [bioreactor metagenome]|uniref:NfeD-like C-terminal domain-containing protein n=1 Tax=bioreactor metagenome TaxID=1076179 RepID=A0A644X8Y6_9ZZZZ